MPGSLFREWKVALAFVAGIAMLAGAFVSDGGEHRYFEQFKPRQPDAEVVAAPASADTQTAYQPAHQRPSGGFSSDAELEAGFADPEAAEAKVDADPAAATGPAATAPDGSAFSPDAVGNEIGLGPPAVPVAVQP